MIALECANRIFPILSFVASVSSLHLNLSLACYSWCFRLWFIPAWSNRKDIAYSSLLVCYGYCFHSLVLFAWYL